MDEKGKKTSISRGRMPTQHMDEKGKKHLHQEVECQPNIWMRKGKKKKTSTSRGRIPNQYMDEKRMRLPPWWNFRVSIGQNMCNIQYNTHFVCFMEE